MPRKTRQPRKPGQTITSHADNRRVMRPGEIKRPVAKAPARDPQFDRRPPKFPGRLGGR